MGGGRQSGRAGLPRLRFTGLAPRGALQPRQPLVQALRALRLDYAQAPIHRFKERLRVTGRSRRRQLRQGVRPRPQQLALAAGRLNGRFARDGAVTQRREGVDVRPRPVLAAALVLLRRRVAGRGDGRHAPAPAAQRLPRRAEVQQHGRLVRAAHEDVRGLHVPVQEPRRMHFAQTVRHRQRHPL